MLMHEKTCVNPILCIDDNKVSDYRYDFDFKGQGQIYIRFILWLGQPK